MNNKTSRSCRFSSVHRACVCMSLNWLALVYIGPFLSHSVKMISTILLSRQHWNLLFNLNLITKMSHQTDQKASTRRESLTKLKKQHFMINFYSTLWFGAASVAGAAFIQNNHLLVVGKIKMCYQGNFITSGHVCFSPMLLGFGMLQAMWKHQPLSKLIEIWNL